MFDQTAVYILEGLIALSVVFIFFLLPLGEVLFTKK